MVKKAKARIQAAASVAETQPAAEPAPVAEPAAVVTPAPAPAPPSAAAPPARSSNQQHRSAWANAMTTVAEEFTAELKDLPPREVGRRWRGSRP